MKMYLILISFNWPTTLILGGTYSAPQLLHGGGMAPPFPTPLSCTSVPFQDPAIFSGSLRMNLDPYRKFSDSELWSVLETVRLKVAVVEQGCGLSLECGETGHNLR